MKLNKITSYIIASCIALGGISTYSSNSTSTTLESSDAVVTISSNFVQDALIQVPAFPNTQTNNRNSQAQQTQQTQQTQQGQRVVGNMPDEISMVERFQPQTQAQNSATSNVSVDGYNDPGIYMQYAITETNADLAWADVEQQETITIAVIDTGVDYTHDDLKNRVSTKYGYDFVNNDKDPMDDNGHGTHVAGIIAAEGNNGVGIVGMVGDLDVEIIPIKALDADGTGDVETVVKALEYAIFLNVDVINLSFGTESQSRELDAVVAKAIEQGIFVVVAAGNSSTLSDFSSPIGVEGVCAVGATTQESMIATYSNFGVNIDVGAPGSEIVSTYPNNQYSAQSGTSQACPIVSSAVAILLAQDPTLTVDEINELLVDNVSDVYRDRLQEQFSFGIVDMYASLSDVD